MAVAIALADLTVASVDQQFGALVTGDRATVLNGFGLGLMQGRCSRATGGLDGPAGGPGGDVLVTGQGCSPTGVSDQF